MTTPSTTRKAGPLLGTGAQTTWPFTFKVFAATDIAVTIADSLGVETALTYGVDYTVTLNANQETSPGGTVTYPISGSPLPVGSRLVIVGNLPYDQPLDLPSGGNFSPLALENQLDRIVMQIQQLRENVGRALQLPVSTTGALSVQLPQPAPNELIGWDSGGTNLANTPLSDIGTAIAYGSYRYETFTGNGSTTTFALSEDPAVLANLDVSISGVVQVPGTDYSLVAGNLVFTSAPANGTTILARYGQALPVIPDSDQVSFVQAGSGAVTRTVQDKLRDAISVTDFGADPTGVTDAADAFQKAVNTGKPVYVPAGTYTLLNAITYTGRVVIFGDGHASRIRCDNYVLNVSAGTGSLVDNLYLENITAPWIITRDPANWSAVVTPVQSNGDGYQPTVNDLDIWGSLTSAQQNQDIGPKIRFYDNASNIVVSRIYGRFVSVMVADARESTVRDCDFRAGKNFGGGIMFWNIDAQSGSMNSAVNNKIRYASFCGVMMANNFNGLMMGNHVSYCGESGLKTYQGDVGGNSARCFNTQIIGNYTEYNYYDGIDISSEQPTSSATDSRYQVIGNNTFGNRRTGFVGDGRNNQIVGNRARFNGLDGFILDIGYSLFSNNYAIDNNQSNPVSGHHSININGENNSIIDNYIQHDPALTGYAMYAANNGNFIFGNKALGSSFFFGLSGTNNSVISNNTGTDTTFGSGVRMGENGAIEQTSGSVPAMRLYSESSAFDNVDQVFHPRKNTLANPIAAVRGLLTVGTSGSENGWAQLFAAQGGVLIPGVSVQTSNSHPGKAWPVLSANNAGPVTADMQNGSVVFYLDESGNNLKATVKYSNGTVKTGTVSVV